MKALSNLQDRPKYFFHFAHIGIVCCHFDKSAPGRCKLCESAMWDIERAPLFLRRFAPSSLPQSRHNYAARRHISGFSQIF
jgi:hypothetical protein